MARKAVFSLFQKLKGFIPSLLLKKSESAKQLLRQGISNSMAARIAIRDPAVLQMGIPSGFKIYIYKTHGNRLSGSVGKDGVTQGRFVMNLEGRGSGLGGFWLVMLRSTHMSPAPPSPPRASVCLGETGMRVASGHPSQPCSLSALYSCCNSISFWFFSPQFGPFFPPSLC